MLTHDYVIVGGGAAGCVLAYRLSANPAISVALVEAGPRDRHPFISMPKGLAKVMQDPQHLWVHASKPEASTAGQSEMWVRGRVLGGSSAVNGMMYVRGQPADFDAIAELTSDDWNWDAIKKAYFELENHELGAEADHRGAGGPLNISMPTMRDRLSEAQVAAGVAMGWQRKEDVNQPDNDVGVGFAPRTIWKGKRQSAATAFLRPAESRANLTIYTGHTADKILFDGQRAVAIECEHDGQRTQIAARHEIIICGGAMASPALLERSGIGDTARLAALGIDIVQHSPQVGENLIEHRGLIMQWKLSGEYSQNREFSGWRLLRATLRYYLTGDGPMSAAAYEIGGWFKTRPGLNRPDAQMLIAPFSFDFEKQRTDVERFPGMNAVIYPLRPTSRGSIHIESRDPQVAASFTPNYRATEEDRAAMTGAVRIMRDYVKQTPLAEMVSEETMPGPAYSTDAEILDAYDRFGSCGYHAVGSCRMGKDAESVVDPALRVRGVERLRVIDTSIMPVIPAGNTQGPTMAMAWRAADIILRDYTSGQSAAQMAAQTGTQA